ncbi:MAG: hypothetical protein FWD53_10880, partial [Phycisphaerales bacterium]|nr:hypothetical protein [Phycisphaerales bacterium]
MKKMLMATLIGAMVSAVALGAEPVGDPVLDPPTLHCLGAYWIIRDTDAKPATVISEYRKVGTEAWLAGPPFIRVVKETEEMRKTKYGNPFFDEGGQPKTPAIRLAEDERMFAGSLFVLQPDTVYEWRLTLTDSDGTKIEKILKDKTIAEPVIPADMTKRYVIPGDGGGSGTQADPFKGL